MATYRRNSRQESGDDPDLRGRRHGRAGHGRRRPGPAWSSRGRPRTRTATRPSRSASSTRARTGGANRARKGHFEKAGVAPMRTLAEVAARRRRRAEARRQGALRHVQGAGPRRRHRRLQGQGLRGRRQAPPLPRRRGDPRLDVPPRARARSAPSAFPVARLSRATRSSGRLGGRQATTKNLIVVRVDAEKNLIYLSGAVPGARRSLVKIVRSSFGKERQEDRRMAKIAVRNWKKEQVGEVELPAGVFEYPYRKHLVWEAVKAYLARAARGHAQDQDAVRGLGHRQEALEAEGHGPRPAGRRPPADPPPRRHLARPGAALLRAGPLGRREEERAEGGPLAARARGADSWWSRRWTSRATGRRTSRPPSGGSASRARRSSWTRATTRTSRAPRATSGVEARGRARGQRLRRA